jgi:predicted small secreted protein
MRRAIATPDPFLSIGIANQEEEIMKTTSLIVALLTAGTLTVFGQEGTVQDIKHDVKKAGEKIKEGVETVGEKTKQAAETVGEKTKDTAETVGRKTKETLESAGEKTSEGTKTAHRKSTKAVKKTKAEAGEERSSNHESNAPSPNPSGR